MKNTLFYLIVFVSCCFFSCGNSEQDTCLPDVDVSNIKVDVEIERVDESLFKIRSKEDAQAFLNQYPDFAESFLQRSRYPSDTILTNILYQLATDSSLQVLQKEVSASYGDMANLKKEFEEAFKRIKYHYPAFKTPKIQTIVTGYGKGSDLYVTEDLIVISIEFFMGKDYRFQPEEPTYIANRYSKETIVPFVVQEMSNWFNETDESDRSTLSAMVSYGKSYYFLKSIIPCLPDSTALGYSTAQMDSIQKYKEVIWAHYIDKNVLYESRNLIKKDYIDEAPFTLPISQTWCPGRIGRWTGLQIVKKYMNRNSDVTLPQLMATQDVKVIFEASKYKGE